MIATGDGGSRVGKERGAIQLRKVRWSGGEMYFYLGRIEGKFEVWCAAAGAAECGEGNKAVWNPYERRRRPAIEGGQTTLQLGKLVKAIQKSVSFHESRSLHDFK